MKLWGHQNHLLSEARARRNEGHRAILCVLPTGGGKTVAAAELIRRAAVRTLWIAHLEELLGQARATLERVGAKADVESIQTLFRRGIRQRYDLVIIDEGHHATSRTYREVLAQLSPPMLLGLTATPSRMDGVALGEVFTGLAVGATTSELVRSGVLVPTRVVGTMSPTRSLADHPVDAYRSWCPGKKALWFCASIDGAARLAKEFTAAGFPAASLDGRVSRDRRREINERFAAGELRVLTNARLIAEGYDVPDVEVVGLASNMTSIAMLLQAIGRGKRSADGKTEELVLDLAGVCVSLGIHPDEDLTYSLEGRPISRASERGDMITQCQGCGHVFRANEFRNSTCPDCGYVRPGRADPRIVRAEMQEIRAAELRARAEKQPADRVDYLRGLLGEGSRKRARFLFEKAYGYWPSNALIERAGGEG